VPRDNATPLNLEMGRDACAKLRDGVAWNFMREARQGRRLITLSRICGRY